LEQKYREDSSIKYLHEANPGQDASISNGVTMHPGALSRLRQLVTDIINVAEVTREFDIEATAQLEAYRALGSFLANKLGDSIIEDYSFWYGYQSIRHALRLAGLTSTIGPLTASTSEKVRGELVDQICEFWTSIPRTYVFSFPLPSVLAGLDSQIAPGVTLASETLPQTLNEPLIGSQELGALLSFQTPKPPTPPRQTGCLNIEGKGLMEFNLLGVGQGNNHSMLTTRAVADTRCHGLS
jgi:hypothetical protein